MIQPRLHQEQLLVPRRCSIKCSWLEWILFQNVLLDSQQSVKHCEMCYEQVCSWLWFHMCFSTITLSLYSTRWISSGLMGVESSPFAKCYTLTICRTLLHSLSLKLCEIGRVRICSTFLKRKQNRGHIPVWCVMPTTLLEISVTRKEVWFISPCAFSFLRKILW